MTKRQQQEVEYLTNLCKCTVHEHHIGDYIKTTTQGSTVEDKLSNNPLREAKQRFDVTVAMWREDLINGLISYDELAEEAHPFQLRVVNSLMRSILKDIGATKECIEKYFRASLLNEKVESVSLLSRSSFIAKTGIVV